MRCWCRIAITTISMSRRCRGSRPRMGAGSSRRSVTTRLYVTTTRRSASRPTIGGIASSLDRALRSRSLRCGTGRRAICLTAIRRCGRPSSLRRQRAASITLPILATAKAPISSARERHGPFRLAILPIGAYEPRWFMSQQHMNPEESVKAFLDCGAELALGHHYVTSQLTAEPIDAPVKALAAARVAAEIAPERFRVLQPGEVCNDKRLASKVGKPCLHLGIGEARVDLLVELIAGRGAPTAIDPSDARGCRPIRREQTQQSSALAATDRLAPTRCATRPAAQQRLRPYARMCGGEVSWRSNPLVQNFHAREIGREGAMRILVDREFEGLSAMLAGGIGA